MIPFITRHIYNLPRTTRNMSKVKQDLKDFAYAAGLILAAAIGAGIAWVVTHLSFGL